MSATNTENWQQGHYAKKQILGVGGLIGWSHRRRFQVALEVARSLQPQTMLDYGCGDGTFLALLRSGENRLERAVGAEIGQSLVDDCRQRLGQDKVLEFILTPELQQPEQAGRYDVIFCMEVLEHVVDWTPVIEDFARLLRPGGALVISVPVETGPALGVKQIFRRLAALRGHGDYPGSHPYTWGEFFQSVFAGDKQHIVRPLCGLNNATPHYDHKGFNWRVLLDRLRKQFDVEKVFGSPLPFLSLSSQAWMVLRRRPERKSIRCLNLHSGNLFGGVEAVMINLAKGQAHAPDCKFEFAFAFDGKVAQELRRLSAPVHDLPPVRTAHFWTILRSRSALRRLLEEQKYDVVICHSIWCMAVYGKTVRRAGVKLVYWQKDWLDGKHWLQKWAKRHLPDQIFVNSHYSMTSTRNVYPLVGEVIYNPVILETVTVSEAQKTGLRQTCDTPTDAVVIVQVSRLEGWKGHKLHLQALALLKDSPHWICWMVGGAQRPGEAVYLKELQSLASDLGIAERIRWLGQRFDIPVILGAADIFCQPNLSGEPFGLTFVEALSAGLPVVATDMGGAKEIVTPECGLLTPPGNAGELAKALRQLIENPSLRLRLGGHGPRRALLMCDISTQIPKLAALLKQVVS